MQPAKTTPAPELAELDLELVVSGKEIARPWLELIGNQVGASVGQNLGRSLGS